jgi:16S rRNA G966 N2-methylase RsmD
MDILVGKKIKLKKMKNRKNHPDLSEYGNSVTSRLLVLITPPYHNLHLEELKEMARSILNDPETSVSERKKKKYLQDIDKQFSVRNFQTWVANLSSSDHSMPKDSAYFLK